MQSAKTVGAPQLWRDSSWVRWGRWMFLGAAWAVALPSTAQSISQWPAFWKETVAPLFMPVWLWLSSIPNPASRSVLLVAFMFTGMEVLDIRRRRKIRKSHSETTVFLPPLNLLDAIEAQLGGAQHTLSRAIREPWNVKPLAILSASNALEHAYGAQASNFTTDLRLKLRDSINALNATWANYWLAWDEESPADETQKEEARKGFVKYAQEFTNIRAELIAAFHEIRKRAARSGLSE